MTQGAQTRWFGYDSLSRLIRVKNPETAINSSLPAWTDPVTGGSGWSTAYTYDHNGNLLTKTDARNVFTSYNYDALNRMSEQSVSDPNVSNTYDKSLYLQWAWDGATNGKGRLWSTYDASYEGGSYWVKNFYKFNAYDALGRPTSYRQDFIIPNANGTVYTTYVYSGARTYDLAGNLKSQTYPSGRTVSYSYNSAGQMSSFTGNLGGGGTVSYATGMAYNARGQMIREQFGTTTALYQRKHYNRRGQLYDIRLGTDGSPGWDVEDPQVWQWANGSWNRGAIRLYYSASQNDYTGPNPAQADNNGNVSRMDHFVPTAVDASNNITNWVLGADTYLYDELNRITRVTETYQNYAATSFKQSYLYDRYGNRTIDLANTDTIGGGVTRLDFKALTATNRLVAQTDTTGDDPGSDLMRYDKAGNLVWDNFSPSVSQRGAMTYDAENRMVTAASGTQRYRYDANGRRVKRLTGQTGEVWQVYDPDGQLLAEYPKQGAVSVPTKEYGYRGGQMLVVFDSTEAAADDKLKWLVQDHLGSTRMLVNRSGSLSGIKRRDYLPFGEELASTVGHRAASGSGYAVDDKPRQKFGSKERDTETGLDYFLARYYSNTQGRFISVDPENAGAVPDDPQSWNSYAYARNNPVVFSDPDGRKYLICSPDGKECYEHSDEQFYDGRRAGREGGFTYTGDEGFFEKGEIRDKDGNVIATYQQISIDDRAREFAFAMQVSLNDPEIVKRAARNALSSAIIGFFLGRVTGQPRITTRSLSRNAALQEAKLANDIPVSKSPDRVIKPNTAEGSRIGLDNRNVRLYEYTNNKGQKIWIREDNAASYGSPGGAGDQGPHFNSGPAGDQKNLKSHHYWDQ